MRKKRGKIINRKNFLKRKNTSIGIIPILFIVTLLALFSEAARTIPAGAFSEKLIQQFFEIPKLNSKLIEKKILNKSFLINNNTDYQNTKDKMIIDETKIIAKTPEIIIPETNTKILKEEKIEDVTVDVPKVEETIKVAADTKNKLKEILESISEEEGTGTSINNKNITYMQILQKPNDLDLNLKYAQQQGKMGNYKQTISTLERLSMIYPDNTEIKLYLLSVLVQADSPEKAKTIIEEMKLRKDLNPEDLETLNEIEEEIKDKEPGLWKLYADYSLGAVHSDNVNSVSSRRLKLSSGSLTGSNAARHDRTLSGSVGFTATRPIGEESSFMINLSHTLSEQYQETDDDYQSYGLTLAMDTVLGGQSLSPYFMLSKSDYQTDADSFSLMYGVGGFFDVGERNSFSYGYSYSDSKANHNLSDTTANEGNAIGHGYTLGHDFIVNELISTSLGLGYSDSDAKVDAGNDFETYDFSFRVNLAFPWAYISIGQGISFNDYKKEDSSVTSTKLRSDHTSTTDIMLTKAIGDIFPTLDPNRSFFINLSYEKLISNANIINYDYIADSFSLSFNKSFKLN
jgi:tetratricopeptide (TPR) repeat protein